MGVTEPSTHYRLKTRKTSSASTVLRNSLHCPEPLKGLFEMLSSSRKPSWGENPEFLNSLHWFPISKIKHFWFLMKRLSTCFALAVHNKVWMIELRGKTPISKLELGMEAEDTNKPRTGQDNVKNKPDISKLVSNLGTKYLGLLRRPLPSLTTNYQLNLRAV